MNVMTSPAALAASAAPAVDTPLPIGIIPLIAEYTQLRRGYLDREDDHPLSERQWAIEDVLCSMRPANVAEAAALLRWAIARHPNMMPDPFNGVSGDDILCGAEPTDEQVTGMDFCERSMWFVVQLLDQLAASDAAIEAAFADWQAAVLVHGRYRGSDEEGERLCGLEMDASRRVAELPARSPRGMAIKAFMLTIAMHGESRDHPFRPDIRPVPGTDYEEDRLSAAVFRDVVELYPDLKALSDFRDTEGRARADQATPARVVEEAA